MASAEEAQAVIDKFDSHVSFLEFDFPSILLFYVKMPYVKIHIEAG